VAEALECVLNHTPIPLLKSHPFELYNECLPVDFEKTSRALEYFIHMYDLNLVEISNLNKEAKTMTSQTDYWKDKHNELVYTLEE